MRLLKGLLVFILLVLIIGLFERYVMQKITLKPKIGIIYLKGTIDSEVSSNTISLLEMAQKRNDIKAVILRIESPGGAVAPSQEMYRFIMNMRSVKKVYASIGSVGASGAYYVASACNKIFADPGSLVGSIGVIFVAPEVSELFNKIGVHFYVVKSGKYKDIGSPFKKMSPEEREVIQSLINNIYDQFVSDVAKARGVKVESIRKIADGRVFTGTEAKGLGLVDEIGSLNEAVERLSRDLGYRYRLETVVLRKKKGFFEKLSEETLSFIREVKLEILGGIR